MNSLGLPYTEAPGEAAFYGPKLDIQLADVMGHQETYSTIQIDFHLPNQFELGYIGADGQEHRPVMIHRGVISTMERMVSYLIELYAGAFPAWLAPVQAIVLPITERQNDYAEEVYQKLLDAGIRVGTRRSQRKTASENPRRAAPENSLHAGHRRQGSRSWHSLRASPLEGRPGPAPARSIQRGPAPGSRLAGDCLGCLRTEHFPAQKPRIRSCASGGKPVLYFLARPSPRACLPWEVRPTGCQRIF